MLTVDWTGTTSAIIGKKHGLDPKELTQTYQQPLAQAVDTLVSNANKPGAWSRWLTLGQQPEVVSAIQSYAQSVQGRYEDVVLIGIGGSSLGPKALVQALRHPQWNLLSAEKRHQYPRFHVLDHMDSDVMQGLWDVLDLSKTLFVVVSKSGTTIEPTSAMADVLERYDQKGLPWADHLVAITDPEKGLLRPFANKYQLPTFEVPDDVGGRFSVFSPVGLLPAALVGIDIEKLMAGIQSIYPAVTNPDWLQNPAAQGAAILVESMKRGKPIHGFMPYSRRLALVADWFVQLWAESLGKAKNLMGETVFVGPTPTKGVGPEDQHSQLQLLVEGPHDKVTLFVSVEEPDQQIHLTKIPEGFDSMTYLAGQTIHAIQQAELEGTRESLHQANRPTLTYRLPNVSPESLAQLMFTLMVQTALAGSLLGIDPFDQPGVEGGKIITKQRLSS